MGKTHRAIGKHPPPTKPFTTSPTSTRAVAEDEGLGGTAGVGKIHEGRNRRPKKGGGSVGGKPGCILLVQF